MPGNHHPRNNGQRDGQRHGEERPQASPLTAIPSPYYFAPLEDRVWHPEDPVSHDVPYSDGMSGTLEFEVEAMRPLYIRSTDERPKLPDGFRPEGNHPKDLSDGIARWTQPYSIDGVPAIPGSSLRGVVRSVLKIVTSGSMKHADNQAISMRDLHYERYQRYMTDQDHPQGYLPRSQPGWVRESKDGSWELIPCNMSRVEQELIEDLFHPPVFLGDRFEKDGIAKKYKLLAHDEHDHPVREVEFESQGGPNPHQHSTNRPMVYDAVTHIKLANGGGNGSLVVMGQPSKRKTREQAYNQRSGKQGSRGKHMEFIFHSPARHEISDRHEAIKVPKEVKEDFLATHHPGSEEVESWKFWKKHLKKREWIPVFFLEDEGGVWAMGLAQMFRLAGISRIHDGMPAPHLVDKPDFADSLLGHVSKSDSLAGRISFGHACCTNGIKPVSTPLWTVLGSPRASFYPNYIAQKSQPGEPDLLKRQGQKGNYDTWLSPEIRLRGWKRYAIRPDCPADDANVLKVPKPPSYSAATAFRPLPSGALFCGRLAFHNLRPHELGALVWVLTWGGDGTLRHSLGMAKPLGFGSVRISVVGASQEGFTDASCKSRTLEDCIKAFELKLDQELPGWKTSTTLKELLALANPAKAAKILARDPKLLGYPAMVMNGENQFAKAKGGQHNNQLILPNYRVRVGDVRESQAQNCVPARRQTLRTPSSGTPMAPAIAKIPKPSGPPPVKIGDWVDGEIIQIGSRLKFLPKGRPESEAGNIFQPPTDLQAGFKCKAKIHNITAGNFLYKQPMALD